MTIFPQSPLSDEIQEPEKPWTSTDHISANIANQDLKFLQEVPQYFDFALYKFQLLNLRRKKVIAQIPQWHGLGEIQEPKKTLPSTDHIFENIANQDLKFLHNVPQDFGFAL